MRTICNVEKRLPALRSPAAGAELEFWHPGAQRKLVESQTARLHELRRELLGGLTALLESSRGMRRAVAQAEQSLTPDLRRSPVALTRATAPLPSLADCLQALRDMSMEYEAEFFTLKAVVEEVASGTLSAEELDAALQVAGARSAIQAQKNLDMMQLMFQTEEKKGLVL
ncbi:hypothetical protein H632_c1851p1 [Helicosporidium sp. ATCC 50920]|nr:hypothetical protein H632_c1851p1 [Helicosporidium sp. ATCC 50920]|eukprot:KDD73771.1 hypothetical protein H632_c1851p1 [Helicosporidium sp. ATCC 50920]